MSELKGLCSKMCPEKEIKWRENEHLLHKFEILEDTERDRKPIADVNKAVKQFSRPAAGQKTMSAESLRPGHVLSETVEYLIQKVLLREEHWAVKYEFISDRMRSICQDMTILRLSGEDCIFILECCVRFYVFSSYRLCEEKTVMLFDQHINQTLLMECLKRLLVMYKEENLIDENLRESNFPELVSIYLLYNIGAPETMQYALELSPFLRSREPLKSAWEVSLAFWSGNLYRALKYWTSQSLLLRCCLYPHYEAIRRNILQRLNVAYSSKNCQFNVSKLAVWLGTADDRKTFETCQYYGIKQTDKTSVNFSKGSFQADRPLLPMRKDSKFDGELQAVNISDLILGGYAKNPNAR